MTQVQNPVILIIFASQSNKSMEDEFDIRDARVPESEREYENALRPLSFHDFSGQAKVVENLKIFVMAARPCAVAWTSRIGKDYIIQHYSE